MIEDNMTLNEEVMDDIYLHSTGNDIELKIKPVSKGTKVAMIYALPVVFAHVKTMEEDINLEDSSSEDIKNLINSTGWTSKSLGDISPDSTPNKLKIIKYTVNDNLESDITQEIDLDLQPSGSADDK